jgi:hypothetical protein
MESRPASLLSPPLEPASNPDLVEAIPVFDINFLTGTLSFLGQTAQSGYPELYPRHRVTLETQVPVFA